MTKVVIYTDFDGTVTRRPGSQAVFTEFYQSLLQGYKEKVEQDYKHTPMKDPKEVQSLFEAKFGKYDEHFDHTQQDVDFLMTPDAVEFFHKILKNDDVTVNIVTKNRVEYIKALFKYHGFSEKEINQLTILDSGYKFDDVNSQLGQQKDKASRIYILDDSEADYSEMLRAAKCKGYGEEEIRGYNLQPGQFKWTQYLKDIEEIAPPKVKQKEDELLVHSEDDVQHLQERPLSDSSSNNRNFKIMGAFSGIGFIAGFVLGITLVATGVFAPFGLGILGALALGSLIGVAGGALSGAVGFGVAKGTESKSATSKDESSVANESSHGTMRALGGSLTQDTKNSPPTAHFPGVLSKPSSAKGNTHQEESVLGKPFTK